MKKILLIVTGIIIFISIPVVVFFFGQQQELRSKATPATTLSINPNTTSVRVGETVVCQILINTGENKVASAKVSLLFDQTKFEALSITNGTLAPRILTQGTVGSGTATITVAAQNTAKPITGQGEIAVVRLKAIGGSPTPIAVQFTPDTFVAGIGENPVNVLISNQPGLITITGGETGITSTMPSATPIPTLIPTSKDSTPQSLYSQPASSSAITISVHTEATRSGIPLVQGTASPGATVTIVIHSKTPQTSVVTADTKGNWETTPPKALSSGTYTVVVTALNPTTGTTETSSTTFSIGGGIGGLSSEEGLETATGDALPESGSMETTLILLFIGSTLVVLGAFSLTKQHI